MSSLLLDAHSIPVQPKLATKIGLNESIVLQQVHFFLIKKLQPRDGRYWTYNSYNGWKESFPFWSDTTIKRTFLSLEKQGLLITANYNKMKMDKTKWYSIEYDKLKEIFPEEEEFDGKVKESQQYQSGHYDQTKGSERTEEGANLAKAIPKTSSKTSSNINNIKDSKSTTSPKKVSKKVKKVYEEDHPYYKLSELLYKQIIKTAPRTKQPNIQSWCDEFRKMVELDNITDFKEIQSVILFAHNDNFWRSNILSAKKLREKYATLHAKMIIPKGGNNNGTYWTSNGGTTETNTGEDDFNELFRIRNEKNAHKFKPVDTTMHDVF